MTAVPALSYSAVRTYQECPLRYKFLYIDHLSEAPRGYFSFGKTVHSVLEALVRPLVVPGPRVISARETQRTLDEFRPSRAVPAEERALMSRTELLDTYRREWLADGYNSHEEEERYRALGQEILLACYDQFEAEPPTPVAVEQHLEARWDGIEVHGFVDRLDRTPTGGLEVLDYKTTRELTHEDAKGSDQLALYQVLVAKNYAEPVERLTLLHLRSLTPLSSPPREKRELGELHGRVTGVRDGIRDQRYDPTPGRHCGRCEFKAMCPEFRDVPEADRQHLAELVDRFHELRAKETKLEEDLRATANSLHQEAERLGVHRLPGSRGVVVRRRDEALTLAPEAVRLLIRELGLDERLATADPELVQRLLKDRPVDPGLLRRASELGTRRVRWFWELEGEAGPN